MSGPCRLTYEIIWFPLMPRRIGDQRAMKCWSRDEGIRVLDDRSTREGWGYKIVDFNSAPTFPFAYRAYRNDVDEAADGIVRRKSRRDARRWVSRVNKLFGSTHTYRLVRAERPKPALRINSIEGNVMHATLLAPPGNITQAKPEEILADPAKFLPADAVDDVAKDRLKALPEIDVGDTIIARLTVSHMGLLPPALCGVKVGQTVIAFEEKDILDVVKAPKLRSGGKAIYIDGSEVDVMHIEGGFAMVSRNPIGSIPFVAEWHSLRAL